ncbi:hypothetical protein [Pseudoroseicyclus tamaricis]|uniref:Uncharacterized protein n=1 Tax=Pseudoroseicyclus tamaricis TaxID=2705421 RepID=A0A6B2K1T5_9RHOB|nr:hypothetical protein [Pseudoroseicyclus tamaricis]NDV01722.1 hypothetical protein [Pseudoroseicyclus tamaricis]
MPRPHASVQTAVPEAPRLTPLGAALLALALSIPGGLLLMAINALI